MGLYDPDIGRLLAAYGHKKHDRVPNFDFIDPLNVERILQKAKPMGLRSDFVSPSDAVELARRTHQDCIITLHQYWPTLKRDDQDSFYKSLGSIHNLDDLACATLPDHDAILARVKSFEDATRDSEIGVGLGVAGPFFSSYMGMGPIPIQSFLLNIYDDLPFIESIMDIQVQWQIEILENLRGRDISFIEIADDLCDNTGFLVDPSFIEEIWAPRALKLLKVVKSFNVPIQWHCCGKLDGLLPKLVEWEIDAVTPIQPSCNDIYRIKKEYGKSICLVGNMNIEGVLFNGSPEEVRDDTKKHIERLADDGGYVVASSHSIVDAIPLENYTAMIDTAVECGEFH